MDGLIVKIFESDLQMLRVLFKYSDFCSLANRNNYFELVAAKIAKMLNKDVLNPITGLFIKYMALEIFKAFAEIKYIFMQPTRDLIQELLTDQLLFTVLNLQKSRYMSIFGDVIAENLMKKYKKLKFLKSSMKKSIEIVQNHQSSKFGFSDYKHALCSLPITKFVPIIPEFVEAAISSLNLSNDQKDKDFFITLFCNLFENSDAEINLEIIYCLLNSLENTDVIKHFFNRQELILFLCAHKKSLSLG